MSTSNADRAHLIHTAHLTIREPYVEAFRARVIEHAETSRREPGCLQFDVYQDGRTPTLFFLFEIYRCASSLAAHRSSSNFLAFRRDVDAWVNERQWWYWTPIAAG